MNKFIFFLTGIFVVVQLNAQISEGGIPPSFNYPSFLKSGKFDRSKVSVPVKLDIEELKKEDNLAKEIAAPMRIAASIPFEKNIFDDAETTILPDGTLINRFTVEAADAVGVIFSYDEFYIPEGGRLFIYNADRSQILGAYTHITNPKGQRFSTQIIEGSEFTFEYVESQIKEERPRIVITDIGYIYDNSFGLLQNRSLSEADSEVSTRASASCMININCPEGNDWQVQKRGLVRMSMRFSDGWYVCTGSLINNTQKDGKPYVLTANHCFYREYNNITTEKADYKTALFYLNYERLQCSNTTSMDKYTSLVGATEKVRLPIANATDGLLILLDNEVPEECKPYYNGWDASGAVPQKGVVIHHPKGDIKKISTYTSPATSVTWDVETNKGVIGGHWLIRYVSTVTGKGVTEGGSSGAPLFNENGLIVGTLTGGASFCESVRPGGSSNPDYYGKFWYHFNQAANSSRRMVNYLAPDNPSIRVLEGYDPAKGESITSRKADDKKVIVFPNIADTEINVNAVSLIDRIDVYDTHGRIRYSSANFKSSTVTISVDGWENGFYLVKIKTENDNFTEKIVKR